MRFFPSKKIVWLVIGVIVVEGLFIFSNKNDGFLPKRGNPKPEIAADRGIKTAIFAKDPNTSEKMIAEVTPTDNILNYLSQIGQSLAQGSRAITVPMPAYEPPQARFSENDLTVIAATKENISVYTTRALLVLAAYPSFRDSDPLATISAWLENKDQVLADNIRAQSDGYRKTAEALARIPTPRSEITSHLSLVNTIDQGGVALASVLATYQNAGTGLLAAAHYTSIRSTIMEKVLKLTKRLSE